MAKYNSKKSKHTHVPSHIGFSVLALVALVFGIAVVTNYNTSNQTETVNSNAAKAKTPLIRPNPVSVTTTKQTAPASTKKPATPNYGQSSACNNMGGTCEGTSSKTSGGISMQVFVRGHPTGNVSCRINR